MYWELHHYVENGFSGKLYKITDAFYDHLEKVRWGYGVTRILQDNAIVDTSRRGWLSMQEFVDTTGSKRWIYAFTHPILASLLFNVHCQIKSPVMWECYGEVEKLTADHVALCSKLTTDRVLDLPKISQVCRMKFAFGCVSKVCKEKHFQSWILDWIGNSDRTAAKARKVAKYYYDNLSKSDHEVDLHALAALNMCKAAVIYHDLGKEEADLQRWTGEAAVVAVRAGRKMNVNFDLLDVAEIIMSAR